MLPLCRNALADHKGGLTRRRLITLGVLGLASAAVPRVSRAFAPFEPDRQLSLYNIHTGESASVAYRIDGDYVPHALAEIDHLLRDHRTGEVSPIDPGVLDRLHRVRRELASDETFHVISGFRSESTNELLRARSGSVARGSLHRVGKAVDVFLPGRSIADLHAAALAERVGGVGVYRDFVHLDVGRFRTW
jgi:uncharacterized protein YcbK (DUF882 family)